MKFIKLVPLALLIALVGCELINGPDEEGDEPVINAFTASPQNIAAAGEAVTLSWSVSGTVTGLTIDASAGVSPGSVSGNNVVVNPVATTTYTLTASNKAGEDDQTTTVTVGGTTPPPSGEDTEPPIGNFSVSESAEGPFVNDQDGSITSPDDERVLNLEPGDTFYARVQYSDPSGVAGVIVELANNDVDLALTPGQAVYGFTSSEPTGCTLDGTVTSVDCLYEIQVGSIPNITALPEFAGEFAYVFRTKVTDAAGNESDQPPRGYVTVGSTPTPPTPEPPAPEPGDNMAPNAAFTYETGADDPNTIAFDASASSDPEDGELTYTWAFGDGTTGSGASLTHTYAESGTYEVALTVTDPAEASDVFTQEIIVGDALPEE